MFFPEIPEDEKINVTPAVAAQLMEAKLTLAQTRIDNLRTYHQQLATGDAGPDSAHASFEAVGISLLLLYHVMPLFQQLLPHSTLEASSEVKLNQSATLLDKSVSLMDDGGGRIMPGWVHGTLNSGEKAKALRAVYEPATSLHQQLSKWLSKAKDQLNSLEGVEITAEKGVVDELVNQTSSGNSPTNP